MRYQLTEDKMQDEELLRLMRGYKTKRFRSLFCIVRLLFLIDENRCIECQSCVIACKEGHELPVGVNRRRVVTVNEGIQNKEISVSVACWHCEDAPCAKICPVDCFYIRADGIVLHDKNKCIGCSYCL